MNDTIVDSALLAPRCALTPLGAHTHSIRANYNVRLSKLLNNL